VLDKFLCATNGQQIRGLEDQRKNGWCNAVPSAVLRELIFRTVTPVPRRVLKIGGAEIPDI
jgi:hypothetical protein